MIGSYFQVGRGNWRGVHHNHRAGGLKLRPAKRQKLSRASLFVPACLSRKPSGAKISGHAREGQKFLPLASYDLFFLIPARGATI
jgi:hypothetical protein